MKNNIKNVFSTLNLWIGTFLHHRIFQKYKTGSTNMSVRD